MTVFKYTLSFQYYDLGDKKWIPSTKVVEATSPEEAISIFNHMSENKTKDVTIIGTDEA